jgi:hypothetical protein
MSAPAIQKVLLVSPLSPSEYAVKGERSPAALVPGTLMNVENSLGKRLGTFRVVGEEAIHLGYQLYGVRVREVGGPCDGNEFFAYLQLAR